MGLLHLFIIGGGRYASLHVTRFEQQSASTSASISALSSKLQELAAVLADLRSRQHTLSTEARGLRGRGLLLANAAVKGAVGK